MNDLALIAEKPLAAWLRENCIPDGAGWRWNGDGLARGVLVVEVPSINPPAPVTAAVGYALEILALQPVMLPYWRHWFSVDHATGLITGKAQAWRAVYPATGRRNAVVGGPFGRPVKAIRLQYALAHGAWPEGFDVEIGGPRNEMDTCATGHLVPVRGWGGLPNLAAVSLFAGRR